MRETAPDQNRALIALFNRRGKAYAWPDPGPGRPNTWAIDDEPPPPTIKHYYQTYAPDYMAAGTHHDPNDYKKNT